jgi:hypothetical protein
MYGHPDSGELPSGLSLRVEDIRAAGFPEISARKNEMSKIVDSAMGKVTIDSSGSLIGVVRMEPERSYSPISALLQKHINESDRAAWDQIKEKIDYTYAGLDFAFQPLAEATGFGEKVKAQVKEGKKVLFKPNIVSPICRHIRILQPAGTTVLL